MFQDPVFGSFTDFEEEPREPSRIHIRVKQRTARKRLTIIEGFASDLDLKKIAQCLRKLFRVSSAVLATEDGAVIQLSGDLRHEVRQFLIKYQIWEKGVDPPIQTHGG